MANLLQGLWGFPVNQWIIFLALLFVPLGSGWIVAYRMRRKFKKDLGRRATAADLTSLDAWMKVDEAEQRNSPGKPFVPAAKKSGDTVLANAINRVFAGYKPPAPRVGRPLSATVNVVGMIACAAFATIYSAADRAAWIPHTKVVSVLIGPNQLNPAGNMYCYTYRTTAPGVINTLHCGGVSNAQDLKVTFWGRYDTQTDRTWICRTRQSMFNAGNSLTCKFQRPESE
jgi:hypothetical protein